MDSELFLHRQKILNELLETQGICPLTKRPVNPSMQGHEWLIPRNSGLGKDLKIYHIFNIVLVDASLHDKGFNPCQRLTIAHFKIRCHGHDAIQAWLESLELRTYRDLDAIVSAWESRCQPG